MIANDMNLAEHIAKCPYCGATMAKYWHRLTPGLVHALVKAYTLVCSSGVNRFDKSDLSLSHSEYGNFQKLRFHGLIAKFDKNGEGKRGEWLITHRGAQFLHGELQIPRRVLTYRNHVEDHDDDFVTVGDVIGSQPYFERYETIEFEPGYIKQSIPEAAFFNNKGQGMMFAGEQQQMPQVRM